MLKSRRTVWPATTRTLRDIGLMRSCQPTTVYSPGGRLSSAYRPLVVAEQTPAAYWDALPLDQLEAWVRANIPSGASDNLARGLETAHHLAAQKLALVKAADAYLATAKHAAR